MKEIRKGEIMITDDQIAFWTTDNPEHCYSFVCPISPIMSSQEKSAMMPHDSSPIIVTDEPKKLPIGLTPAELSMLRDFAMPINQEDVI